MYTINPLVYLDKVSNNPKNAVVEEQKVNTN
jgi:hypothetical protein